MPPRGKLLCALLLLGLCAAGAAPAERPWRLSRRWAPARKAPVVALALSPDGRLALSGDQSGTVTLWDARGGRALRTLGSHRRSAESVAFSPDGTLALSGGEDSAVLLWDLEGSSEPRRLLGHSDMVQAVAFAADGSALSGSDDGTVRVWEDSGKARSLKVEGGDLKALALSADGRTLYGGTQKLSVLAWDLASGSRTLSLGPWSDDKEACNALAFSPDRRSLLAGANTGGLRLWDLSSGRPLKDLPPHAGNVDALAFSSDGRTAASGAWDGKLRLWDLAAGALIAELDLAPERDQANVAVFTPGGLLVGTTRGFLLEFQGKGAP